MKVKIMTKTANSVLIGFIAYGIAMLLFLQIKTFSFIGFFIIVVLVILGTKTLSEFWIDAYNLMRGLMIFLRSLISDYRNKDANGK